jgi:hypothetical protein
VISAVDQISRGFFVEFSSTTVCFVFGGLPRFFLLEIWGRVDGVDVVDAVE